jgi:leader peptidase (prepilin peptidase) / N-methyltransferase
MPLWLMLAVAAPFIGSFLGVLVHRLPKSEHVVMGRSRCEACDQILSPIELVPVASWLLLRGQCRACGAPLGWFYPAIEIGALILALWAAAVTSGAALVASCVFGWTLLALAVVDWRHYLLPDPLVLLLLTTGFGAAWFVDPESLADHASGAAVGFASIAALAFCYRRLRGRDGLGFGDAKLVSALGAWLSWEGLPSVVLLAAMLGLLLASARTLAGANLSWSDRLPFGSFLAAAGWLTWLYGPLMIG